MGVVLSCKDLHFKEKLSNSKIMLNIYSSGIGEKYSFSASTMLVLFSLTYHFNTIRFDMFPKQNYIVQKTGLSASSVKRAIQELIKQNLLLKKRTQYGNTYQFTPTFFNEINLTQSKDQINRSKEVKKIHPIKEQKNKNNKKKSSFNQNFQFDDEIIKILKQWNYLNIDQLLKKHTKQDILNTIKQVQTINPKNKGAYFRTLIESLNNKYFKEEINKPTLINSMIKYQYWKHKPSNQIIKIKPDIGNHLNFKYDLNTQMVIIHKENIIDKLENFEVVESYKEDKIEKLDRSSKQDLISQMIKEKQYKEAFQLAKIFKLQKEYQSLVS